MKHKMDLSNQEIGQLLRSLCPNWNIGYGNNLYSEFHFDDFQKIFQFLNVLAQKAIDNNFHENLSIKVFRDKCSIEIFDGSGLYITKNLFDIAKCIDSISI